MKIRELLGKKFLFFDGAMGTMLQNAGLRGGELPELYNMTNGDTVIEIHKKYIEAGSDIITTNTFGANELKLKDSGYTVEEIVTGAVKLARKAAGDGFVALDIGPIGQLMEPMGTLSFERAYEIVSRQVRAGAAAGADIVLIETLSDLYEAKAAVLAAKENCSLPVFCTMTFQEDGRTLTGTDPLTMVNVLQGLGVDALGVNCSLGPKELMPIVEEILRYSQKPVIVQANAGLPKLCCGQTVYEVKPEDFAGCMKAMAAKGAALVGGCCGTNPDFIKALRSSLEGLEPIKTEAERITAVSSASKTVILGRESVVIGERINPTGKKKFKEALRNNDMDYILSEAIYQKEAGADILDVNVGLPEIDEKATMVRVVREIQGIINLPLQIDSSNAEAIEAAVRVYNGKPIINSVNGKKEAMEAIFPIAARYGACVVGLTMDEKGIPLTAEERAEVAGRILEAAETYGIPREDILMDCLVLTASAQQQEVMETVKAVGLVKSRYGVKTVLGVSNVSFGLPSREILNATFYAMALAYGLDAAIINPMAEDMMRTLSAFKVLANQDREAKKYVDKYSNVTKTVEDKAQKTERDLTQVIIDGLREEAAAKTTELLKTTDSMNIVDRFLIPALDTVGQKYEKGEIFLPQLIQSAETVKNSFGVLKDYMLANGTEKLSKGKILIATVKGDIHDIGKNIVKILLENYGFEVIDLGKDVPPAEIVRVAKEQDIRLVGLSALMTTTVKSMEETISALMDNGVPCRIMVGGAVLNEEYARLIKADYYARDARESVKIAKELFGV